MESTDLRGQIRTMKIIHLAMILGILAFAAFCLTQRPAGPNPGQGQDPLPILGFVAVGMFVINTALSFIIPTVTSHAALASLAADADVPDDVDQANPEVYYRLAGIRQTGSIISAALLEAAAFTALIAYLLSRQTWLLGIVAAVLVVMLIQFPGEGRLRAWIDGQLQKLRGMRQEQQLRK
jgi:hypothetical protein